MGMNLRAGAVGRREIVRYQLKRAPKTSDSQRKVKGRSVPVNLAKPTAPNTGQPPVKPRLPVDLGLPLEVHPDGQRPLQLDPIRPNSDDAGQEPDRIRVTWVFRGEPKAVCVRTGLCRGCCTQNTLLLPAPSAPPNRLRLCGQTPTNAALSQQQASRMGCSAMAHSTAHRPPRPHQRTLTAPRSCCRAAPS
jgi:hypothetical protein